MKNCFGVFLGLYHFKAKEKLALLLNPSAWSKQSQLPCQWQPWALCESRENSMSENTTKLRDKYLVNWDFCSRHLLIASWVCSTSATDNENSSSTLKVSSTVKICKQKQGENNNKMKQKRFCWCAFLCWNKIVVLPPVLCNCRGGHSQ